MPNLDHVVNLKKDRYTWNKWREDNPGVEIDLRGRISLKPAWIGPISAGLILAIPFPVYIRIRTERDTHRRMCIEIDRLEYELLEFHNLMRLTACVPGGWGENGLEMGNCPRQVRRQNQPCG